MRILQNGRSAFSMLGISGSIRGLCGGLLFAAITALGGPAQAGDWVQREFIDLRLISASSTLGEDGMIAAALDIRLAPGWMFYHETPGEYGIAPRFDWARSANTDAVTVHWPKPTEYTYSLDPPINVLGYKDAVILPLETEAMGPGEPATVRLHLQYAVCEEYCVFDEVALSLDLAPGASLPTADADRILQALSEANQR